MTLILTIGPGEPFSPGEPLSPWKKEMYRVSVWSPGFQNLPLKDLAGSIN